MILGIPFSFFFERTYCKIFRLIQEIGKITRNTLPLNKLINCTIEKKIYNNFQSSIFVLEKCARTISFAAVNLGKEKWKKESNGSTINETRYCERRKKRRDENAQL